jgi:hypothetical protein
VKYHNKQKKFRLAEWAVAPPPNMFNVQEAKRWCQQHPSKCKFYFHYTNIRWWFEDKNDALHFALVWSGNIK